MPPPQSQADGRTLMPDRILSMNLATLRNGWSFGEMVDGCLRHGVTAISPWRDQVAAVGLAEAARIVHGQRPARHRPLPRRHVPRRYARPAARQHRRQPPRHRRSGGARRRLPGAGGRRAARLVARTSPAPGRWCADGIAAMLPHARAAACRSRSSRCIRCTPPTAPA